LNSPPPSSSIPGAVSTGIIFPVTHMWTQYLYYIHPPNTLSPSTLPLVPTFHPGQELSALPFSNFVKEKQIDTFACLR
jgi:hypothetical protein